MTEIKHVFSTVFQLLLGAAALKAALNTLSRPMNGQPMQPLSGRLGRFGSANVEDIGDDWDYEELL